MSVMNLTRVFRFLSNNVPQISDFPDDPPNGRNDLEVRTKHFTEIENFTFLGYVLAHELKGGATAAPISTFANLEVPSREFQDLVNAAKVATVTDEELGDTLLDVGINWEHFVASNNNILIPGDPLHASDAVLQEQIDSLEIIAENLVREINLRAMAGK
jgi:hypothetical protein